MAVETVVTTDGGRVEYWVEQDPGSTFRGVIHVQKYDSAGQKLGAEFTTAVNTTEKYQVYALSNGGYVVGATNNTMDGLTLVGGVFSADGTLARSLFGGAQWDLEVSPDGGFMVGSITQVHHSFTVPDARLQLYDNSGQVVRTGTISAQAGPEITVDADGVFHASWTDRGGNPHTLAVDPQNPRPMDAPLPPGGVGWIDDVGASQGVSMGGGGTDDATPTIRITVSEVGWVAYELAYSPGFASNAPSNPSRFVEVTAADVSRGYVELPITTPVGDGNYKLAARFENADGFVSAEKWAPIRIDTHTETQPAITKAVDNEGAQQGDLSSGATTDDTTPTIHISLAGTGAQPFDKVLVFDNGTQINFFQLDSTNAGGFSFTQTLATGSHSITAFIQDMAGNRSPVSGAFNLTVGADAADHTPVVTGLNGGPLPSFTVYESGRPNGTDPDPTKVNIDASVILDARDGVKEAYIDGQYFISNGSFSPMTAVSPGGEMAVSFRSFDAATGRLDFTFHLRAPFDASVGDAGVSTAWSFWVRDQDGDATQALFNVNIKDDQPRVADDEDTIPQGSTSRAMGNVLSDSSIGDEGDADNGRDTLGADGGEVVGFFLPGGGGVETTGSITASGLSYTGVHGTLTMWGDGRHEYVVKPDAPAGSTETFNYKVRDGDGDVAQAALRIRIDPASGSQGTVIQSQSYGAHLNGTAGNDTLIAGQGPDQLTGAGGGDAFVYQNLPWNAGVVTDFAVGTDRLDLSALFQASGYSGSNPQADGYIRLQAEGGGTAVYYDTDGTAAGNTIWFKITTLQGVSGASWAQLAGGGEPPPPPQVGFESTLIQKAEGNSGSTPFEFTLTRTGDTSGTTSMTWSVYSTPAGQSASNDDFAAGSPLSGSLTFAAGETSKTITVQVAGDTLVEHNETFRVVLQGISGGGYGGGSGSATGSILNDDSSQPPPSDGQVIISQRYGDTLVGGAGEDTLLAGRGPDQMTGGGAGDVFIIRETPWNAGVITDFAVGADTLDLSELLQDNGYSGSDPVADGWVRFEQTSGGARVLVDTDGSASGNTIWFNITTLQGVSASGLTWASLSGGGSSEPPPPPPPPPPGGQVLTSDQYGDTLQGGSGNDTLNAGQGPDQLTGAGGADHFVFGALPWNAGRITDFTPGTDKLDLSALFDASPAGSVEFRSDGSGNTQVYFDKDDPNGGDWPFLVTTLTGVAPGQIAPGDWLA